MVRRTRAARRAASVREAALVYFTEAELEQARFRGATLELFDARFALRGDGLEVSRAPDDAWLREHISQLAPAAAVWEVVAFIKVRRLSNVHEITQRARSGELYDESYFTKRGGGAPYVGYPLDLNGSDGNFAAIAESILGRYRPARALDIGCATGELVRALARVGVEADGVDFSPWAVDHAVIDTVVRGSALELPFDDGAFDLVTSSDFMEHMHPDDLPAVIAEQRRVLAPGGTILHLIPFYASDIPEQIDAHLCQASRAWWMSFLAAQPGIEIAREPDGHAPDVVDRYVELRAA
jgi:SAM-dependent methyltransferase